MNVLDLFSGIGGFSLGLERSGHKTIAFCEFDKHCQVVLKKHWPSIPVFNDVKELHYKNGILYDQEKILETKIDIICGGFPCQDISVAGKKRGFEDENGNTTRSGLWIQYKRIIEEVRPRFVLIENVRNLLNIGLATVLKDLCDLGYDAEWKIISAKSVGACHKRERVWIVAYPNSVGQQRSGQDRKSECSKKDCFGETNITLNGSPIERLQTSDSNSTRLEGKRAELKTTGPQGCTCAEIFPDANMPRFWPTFATEEEKSQWWTKTTASFSDWWQTESEFCRVDDGLSTGLDQGVEPEKFRKERIKQLGNAVVPFIPEMIGRRINEITKESK